MSPSLESLLSEVEVLETVGDIEQTAVTAVTQDSASVIPGALYCCIRGAHVDGHDLAGAVARAGASSLLVERVLAVDLAQVRVASARRAAGPVAAAFHGHPSRSMAVAGITGTNGKTTTAYLLAAIAEAAGLPAAVIGTLSGPRTTPEAPVLQAELARLRDENRAVVAMEVSSMALDQHRTDGTRFAVAVWTNLTQDHLDYHGTMEAYFEAKAQLFETARSATAVINADDPWGRRLLARLEPGMVAHRYSMDDADALELGLASARFRWRGQDIRLRMGGAHNVSNAVGAATAASVLGISEAQVADGLASIDGVPGRFEAVDAGQPFTVLVDYAHTPDGLEQVLAAVARSGPAGGRVIVVFGCGGERDRAKRPLMAAVATRLAQRVVLTSDNPRGEDPRAIMAEAAAGAVRPEVLVLEPDRAAAIGLALEEALPGDVVVIAGKGHETVQVVEDTALPFDDREVARDVLGRLGYVPHGAL